MNRKTGLADAYSRYAELITAQIDAVETGDLDAFSNYTRERDAVARSIDSIHAQDPNARKELAQSLLPQLEAALVLDVKLRERLEAIHDQSLAGARSIDRNRSAIRSYASHAEAGTKLDFSF